AGLVRTATAVAGTDGLHARRRLPLPDIRHLFRSLLYPRRRVVRSFGRAALMLILILNTDYPKYLRALYGAHPGLSEASYDAQMAVRNNSLFGVADYYSRNFRLLGHEAAEVHVNNRWIQHA